MKLFPRTDHTGQVHLCDADNFGRYVSNEVGVRHAAELAAEMNLIMAHLVTIPDYISMSDAA